MVTVDHFNKILEKEKYDTIVLNHGTYVPHGVIADIAKSKKYILLYGVQELENRHSLSVRTILS